MRPAPLARRSSPARSGCGSGSTGTPLATAEGYVGVDVHRAARIAAVGHGGQVLISATTAAAEEDRALVDLGEHRLKDLPLPERLYQLGVGRSAPLKTVSPSNLPVPTTPFIGRGRSWPRSPTSSLIPRPVC